MAPTPEALRTLYWLCAAVDGEVSPGPPGWARAWEPAVVTKGNYAVVFQMWTEVIAPVFGPVKVPVPIYALVIQGTHGYKDVFEDFKITPQPAFGEIAGARIAQGSQKATNDVVMLENTSGQMLQDFLKALPKGVRLIVTGHSLGGNVTSVLLPWIAANVPAFGPATKPLRGLPPNLVGVTFAAPTAGNQAFADFLNACPENYFAYFNENDVVSNVWATSGPLQITNIKVLFPWPGPQPAPKAVQDLLTRKINEMTTAHVAYTQTNGTMFRFPPTTPAGSDPWMQELDYQHNYAYCKMYLGDEFGCKP